MSTLEARIAEVLAPLLYGEGRLQWERKWEDSSPLVKSAWNVLAGEYAAMLAPVIREVEAEARAQSFQAVRDNAEFEQEERDGPNLIYAAYLMIDVDKLNGLETSHDGMDWIRITATDYGKELRKAKAEAWRAGFCRGEQDAHRENPSDPDRINPYRSNDE